MKTASAVLVILWAVLSPLLFWTGTRDPFLIKTILTHFLVPLAFAFWISRLIEEKRWRDLRQDPTLLAFLAAAFFTALSAVNAAHASLVWEALCLLAFWCALYLISSELSREGAGALLWGVCFSTLLVCLYGAFQKAGADPISWQTNFGGRPGSSFGNPNFFAGYLVVVFPVVFVMMSSSRALAPNIFLGSLCFLILMNLAWTQTRGAWLAFILSFLFVLAGQFFWTRFQTKSGRFLFRGSFWAFMLMVIVGFVLFGGGSSGTARRPLFDPTDPSVAERLFKWRTAFEMIREHPLLGIGAGNLKVRYALYQARVREKSLYPLRATSESNAHNDFLQIAAETGMFGLLSFLFIFGAYFWRARRTLRDTLGSNDFFLNLGFCAAVLAFLAYGLTNFPMRIVPTAGTLFIFLGLTRVFGKLPGEVPSHLQRRPAPNLWLRGAMGIVLVIFWLKATRPLWRADIEREQGYRAVMEGREAEAVAHLEKALRLDFPHSERTAYDLGEIYRRLQRLEEAAESYRKATALRNYAEVYNNIANCFFLLGRREAMEASGRKLSDQEAIRRMPEARAKAVMENWQMAVGLGLPEERDQKQVERSLSVFRRVRLGKN